MSAITKGKEIVDICHKTTIRYFPYNHDELWTFEHLIIAINIEFS